MLSDETHTCFYHLTTDEKYRVLKCSDEGYEDVKVSLKELSSIYPNLYYLRNETSDTRVFADEMYSLEKLIEIVSGNKEIINRELVVIDETLKEYLKVAYSDNFFLKTDEQNKEDVCVCKINVGDELYLPDAYTKEILSYKLSSKRGDTKPYFDGLNDVLNIIKKEARKEPTILHTDQGSVYSSLSYNELISNYNIKRSMSRAGTPTDNPIIEAVNGWIKAEIYSERWHKRYNTAKEMIAAYVAYFNNERPAYALQYKSPVQFRIEQGFL